MALIQNKNLDDFMPKALQQDYFRRGLKTFAEILSEKDLSKLYEGIHIINEYERKYEK